MSLNYAYIVLVTEALVGQDIAQTIADFDPAAHVILVASLAEAEAALAQIDTVAVAFVAGKPHCFAGSHFAAAITARGGRLVLLGVEAEASGPTADFDVLTQPFDTDAVIRKLRLLG